MSVTWRGNVVRRQVDFDVPIEQPILLMQGFGSSRRALRVLERRLRADGYEVLSVRLGGMFGTLNTHRIEKAAELVASKISNWRRRSTMGPFTIIAHSKGGLIARYMVACLGAGEHVRSVITLGTPHQGFTDRQICRISLWSWCMPSVWQMRTKSQFFSMLRQRMWPRHVRALAFGSDADRVVPLDYTAWDDISDVPQTKILSGVSHTDYLLKHRVYTAIREQLQLPSIE